MSEPATARVFEDEETQISFSLFKTDYPRTIDRYIDYFGSPAADQPSPRRVTTALPARPAR